MRFHRFFAGFAASVALLGCVGSGLAQAPRLAIEPAPASARLTVLGQPGRFYDVEASLDLGASTWSPWLGFTLTNRSQSWLDPEAGSLSRRFFRVVERDSTPVPEANNFRLLDTQGRARELAYAYNDSTVKAYVLVFTGTTCSNLQASLGTLHALADRFADEGIVFWVICSSWGNDRAHLETEAQSMSIRMPVLHDRAQAVARDFGVRRAPEVVAVENSSWRIFYRGAMAESVDGSTHEYLSAALSNFLNQQLITPRLTPARGAEVSLVTPGSMDYATDIAPLLKQRCVTCHSEGNIAPFAMSSYDVVAGTAGAIKHEVLGGHMPPWHADPTVGRFANDSSLRPEETAKLLAWIDAGAPRGSGPDPLTNAPPVPPEWPFGPPDQIVTIPVQNIPARGEVAYRYINVPTSFPTDVWLRAAVVRPGNARVVHHALVFTNTSSTGLDGFFAGYVPGSDPVTFPPDTGKLLRRGQVLRFQMHYITVGTAQTDQTRIGLYVSPRPPAMRLETKSAFNVFFAIPPRTNEIVSTARSARFTRDALLVEMAPHQHLRGKWFNYELERADGTRTPLLSVPTYLFHWQRNYRLVEPLLMPAGSRILCTAAWDNSPQNRENPDPDAFVIFGDQTDDEMFIGYFNYAEPVN